MSFTPWASQKNPRLFYLAQYTAKFFQGTKVKLNCTFLVSGEKSIWRRKSGSPKVGKVRKIYAVRGGTFVDVRNIKSPKDRYLSNAPIYLNLSFGLSVPIAIGIPTSGLKNIVLLQYIHVLGSNFCDGISGYFKNMHVVQCFNQVVIA